MTMPTDRSNEDTRYLECNCHVCTQARYRSSLQGQIDMAMNTTLSPQSAPAPLTPADFIAKAANAGLTQHGPRETVPAEKCGACVISFIAREGSFFPCALSKGHDGGHRAAGNCFKHGEYLGKVDSVPQCSQWPECIQKLTPEELKRGHEQAQETTQPRGISTPFNSGHVPNLEQGELPDETYADFVASEPERGEQHPDCAACGHPALSHDDEFGDCKHLGVTDTGLEDKYDVRQGWWAEEYKKLRQQLAQIRDAKSERPRTGYWGQGGTEWVEDEHGDYLKNDVDPILDSAAQREAALRLDNEELILQRREVFEAVCEVVSVQQVNQITAKSLKARTERMAAIVAATGGEEE